MKKLLCLISLFFFSFALHSQSSSDLIRVLEGIQANLKEITTAKQTYVQELNFKEEAPFSVIFVLRTTDKKGKSSIQEYLFNLGLFDENLVRWTSNKDEMRLMLKAGNQQVAEHLVDGEMKGYENEITIYCPDVDNARILENLFKEAIPLAKSQWKNAINLPKELDALLEWMGQRVGAVSVDDNTYLQKWATDESSKHRVVFTLDETKGKDARPSMKYKFSLSDILPEAIETKIKGKEISILIGTRQKKSFVRVEENEVLSDHKNQLTIRADQPDKAQELIFALKETLPLARTQAEEEYTLNFSDLNEGLTAIQSTVSAFNDGETLYETSIQPTCQTELKAKTTANSKSEENTYAFHFSDLDPSSITIQTKKKDVRVFVRADNRANLIRHDKNSEQQNYANELLIPAVDIPAARRIQAQLKYLTENCKNDISVQDFDLLVQTLGEAQIAELTQQLKKQEQDNACKLAYTATQDNGKKVKSELFEFNLYDLDADDLALKVKGKQVLINLETRSKEKIINNYTDGEKLSYVSNFDMQLKDIPTAKNVVYTLKALIRACQE